jgi:diadenosine tetraphosphate (Ap4A) HIT family hydrolase
MDEVGCALCRVPEIDQEFGRTEVWSDKLWRLTTSIGPGDVTLGFSYLEPRRHIPHIEDLDGDEAETFGAVVAKCSRALKDATNAQRVYVYIFGGGIPHLHVHLAPHIEGDALNNALIKGDFEEHPLPSGAISYRSKDFPELPQHESAATASRIRELLRQ